MVEVVLHRSIFLREASPCFEDTLSVTGGLPDKVCKGYGHRGATSQLALSGIFIAGNGCVYGVVCLVFKEGMAPASPDFMSIRGFLDELHGKGFKT